MDVGLQVRHAREQRRLTLRHVSNQTKVPIGALEAIERNDISHLPGGIFTRGFVRAYATAVGVDPADAVGDFLAQFEDELRPPPDELCAATHEEDAPTNRAALAGALVLGGALIAYTAYITTPGTRADSSPAALLPEAPVISDVADVPLPAEPAHTLIPAPAEPPAAISKPHPATRMIVLQPDRPEHSENVRDAVDVPAATTQQEPLPGSVASDAPAVEPQATEPDPGRN